MNNLKKLEKIKKMKDDGILTEEEFNTEKEKILNKKENKLPYLFLVIILLVIVIIAVIIFKTPEFIENKDDGFKSVSANVQKTSVGKISFKNMSSDDEDLDEVEQEIVKYFDNDYIMFDVKDSQKYPQVFKNAKVRSWGIVKKVLKSDDNEFEILIYETNDMYADDYSEMGIESIPESELYVIKGEQLEERLVANDLVEIYGRYDNVESYQIDGKSYSLPLINIMNVIKQGDDWKDYSTGHRFNMATIKTVAEHIFGKNIKISLPEWNDVYGSTYGYQDPIYMVTLDNQSNANFEVFDMHIDYGAITYNPVNNESSENVIKRLFVSADFNHYIVTTYDKKIKHMYIDYFDREYNKLWSREFDSISNSSNNAYDFNNMYNLFSNFIDYSNDKLAFMLDTDLYLIDLETGKDIISPVIVGKKTQVNMLDDGIVLIGNENKDTIVKVGYDGEILYRLDGDTNITEINIVTNQIVNGKLVVYIAGMNNSSNEYLHKYIVINKDGTIDTSTKDLSVFD